MRIRVFLLASILLGLVCVCAVQQVARQTRIQYELAQVLEREERARAELDRLRAAEAMLLSAARLEALNRRLALNCRPLRHLPESWSFGALSPNSR